ncbi:MAG: DUF58 domain-containing protein [Chloroflexota bacterium]
MNDLPKLPISESALNRYLIRTQQQIRPGLGGSHLTRRQGQSLEFRDFAVYTPGDDIRHVDWRASSRYGKPQDLLVRKFVAEEQHSLVISIDTRDTMGLPDTPSKLQIARWLAEAIAWVGLRSGDQVVLHQLFSQERRVPTTIRGATGAINIRTELGRFSEPTYDARANVQILRPYLPPTAVWIILTDFYFGQEQADALSQTIVQAQRGYRQVLLVELDSWPYERVLVGVGPRRIEGPGIHVERPHYEVTEEALNQLEANIAAHKLGFLNQLRRRKSDTICQWAEEASDGAELFRSCFLNDKSIQNLFVRKTL